MLQSSIHFFSFSSILWKLKKDERMQKKKQSTKISLYFIHILVHSEVYCLLSTLHWVWTMSLSVYLIHHTSIFFNAKGSYPTKNNQCMQLFAFHFFLCLPKLWIAGKISTQINFLWLLCAFKTIFILYFYVCFSFAFVRKCFFSCDKKDTHRTQPYLRVCIEGFSLSIFMTTEAMMSLLYVHIFCIKQHILEWLDAIFFLTTILSGLEHSTAMHGLSSGCHLSNRKKLKTITGTDVSSFQTFIDQMKMIWNGFE